MNFAEALTALGADPNAAVDELGVPIYIADSEGIVRWQNRASLAVVGDIRGLARVRVVAREEREASDSRLAALALPDARPVVSSVLVQGDRGPVRLRSLMQPLRREGQFVGILGVVLSSHFQPARSRVEPTPRQLQVLALLAAGRSTSEIVVELGVAVETARNHIRRLLQTLEVHSRIEAVARGRELGLL